MPPGRSRAAVRPHWCAWQHHGAGRIRHVAVLLDGHVQLDDVAPPQPPRAGDAVHDLVVDADQHRARKPVDERRRRARAMLREEPRRHPIEVRGRDASLRRVLQRFERQADDVTRCAQPVPFSFGGDAHDLGVEVQGFTRFCGFRVHGVHGSTGSGRAKKPCVPAMRTNPMNPMNPMNLEPSEPAEPHEPNDPLSESSYTSRR